MSDELQQPKKILTTEELLSDFFFLIFCPNPNKNNVRVIIDDGTIKLYTNIPKFIKIIEGTMDEKAGTIVKNCCETYGCYYVIDRCENTIRKLNINSEDGVINLSLNFKEAQITISSLKINMRQLLFTDKEYKEVTDHTKLLIYFQV